jgi:hypothetical protein
MKYEVLKKEYVFTNLGEGKQVLICDFNTMRILDCDNLQVSAIQSFLEKENVVFYRGLKNE